MLSVCSHSWTSLLGDNLESKDNMAALNSENLKKKYDLVFSSNFVLFCFGLSLNYRFGRNKTLSGRMPPICKLNTYAIKNSQTQAIMYTNCCCFRLGKFGENKTSRLWNREPARCLTSTRPSWPLASVSMGERAIQSDTDTFIRATIHL